MADGQLNFSTSMDISGVERGLNELLAELKKISAAITATPEIKVTADTTEVKAVEEAIDSIPKDTEVEVKVDADPVEIVGTKKAIEDVKRAVDDIPDPHIDTSSAASELELLDRKINILKQSIEMLSIPDGSLLNADGEYINANAALKDLKRLEKLDAVSTKLEKLEEKKRELEKSVDIDINVHSDTAEITGTKKAVENVGKTTKKVTDEASKEFKRASKGAGTAVNSSCDDILKTLSGTLGKVKGLLAATGLAVGLREIIGLGKDAVEQAAKVNASTSQLEQTFGSFQNTAEEAIKRVADQSGILDTRLRGTATSIYAFAKTTGMDATTALTMMEDALQVAADSAAYYDRSLEDTSETLKSFLKGNYANDAALGLSATEYTRNAAAMKLYGKSFQELSEAQKQLTLLQMVKDANALSGAEGQAAREADGWENVIGNLKEAWSQLLAVVGQPILEVATIAVKNLTAALTFLTEKARAAIAAMNQLLGRETKQSNAMASSIEQSVSNQEALTDAVKETTKAQKKSLAAFDQLNTLSFNNAETAGAGAGSAASTMPVTVETEKAENNVEKFAKKLQTVFSKLKTWWQKNFAPIFNGIWEGLKGEAHELWGTLQHVFADIKSLGAPLLEYFNTYFVPFLQTTFGVIGNILVGLFDTFNKVFADIWDIVIFPYLQTYLTVGLPMLTEFATEAMKTIGVIFDEVKTVFDMIWEDVAKPVLKFIMKLWQDLMESLKKFWDRYGNPIFEKFRTAIQKTSDIFMSAWNSYFKPLFEKLMANIDTLWQEHLKPLVDAILEYVGELITAALDIYNECIAPIVKWVVEVFGPPIMRTIGQIMDTMFALLKNVADVAKGIIEALTGIVKFAAGVFTGDWERAWEGVKKIFKGVFDSLVGIVKVPLNLIIGNINLLLNGIEEMVNAIIAALGVVDFDIPSWVPGIGGKSFHLDLDSVDIPRIPYLAQGTVVPANYGNFLAMLGDNKREAEVVSPVSTMKQAMLEALAESGGAGPKELVVYTYLYPNSAAYHREVINIVNADARNKGG